MLPRLPIVLPCAWRSPNSLTSFKLALWVGMEEEEGGGGKEEEGEEEKEGEEERKGGGGKEEEGEEMIIIELN